MVAPPSSMQVKRFLVNGVLAVPITDLPLAFHRDLQANSRAGFESLRAQVRLHPRSTRVPIWFDSNRFARTQIAQGWPKSWGKFRALLGTLSQNAGTSRAIWANPVWNPP